MNVLKKLAFIPFILLSQMAFAQFDSLKISLPIDTLTTLTSKLDSIETSARLRMDSLTQYYNQATSKVQRLSSHYQQKVDSLSHLNLPTDKYTNKIDSLNTVLIGTKQKAEHKIESIKQSALKKINSLPLPPELQSKVLSLTGSLDKFNLLSLSKLNSPIDIGSLGGSVDELIPSTGLNGIGKLPSAHALPDVGKNLGNVSDLTGGLTEQVGDLQGSVDGITENANHLNQLDKLAESQITKIDAVKDFTNVTDNLPASPLATSEEEAKKLLLDQAKEIAVDHFAGQEEALKSAMDKISKYKQKYSSISSLSEITKRPPNPMKDKPFIERVIPGLQFQMFQKQGNFLTDFNLYAGYRVNGRLTTGIGWNQRVAYNLDRHDFNPKARVFGPRAFSEFKLGRGFSPRAEVEVMNTAIPPYTTSAQADTRAREWIVSGLVGIKKEYRFYKNIKGTTTIMINVFHPYNKSPYPDWVNMRFGFEFPMKKKMKPNPSSN